MQGNRGFELVEEAFHAMSAEAAERYLEMGQMYAERFPRPMALSLVGKREEIKELRTLAAMTRLSPSGVCILDWRDRRIVWSNDVYLKYFVDLTQRSDITGMRIDEVLPAFRECGLELIFETVAATREAFSATAYGLFLPSAGMTHWDWSLQPVPFASSDATFLMVQMHKVETPAQSVAA